MAYNIGDKFFYDNEIWTLDKIQGDRYLLHTSGSMLCVDDMSEMIPYSIIIRDNKLKYLLDNE